MVCARDKEGHVWRIQCDADTKICLYAPNQELDSTGQRVKALERARDCTADDGLDKAKPEASGFKMVAGRPDAPYGWTRDERGRVFQTNFDLKRRMYFGAAYTPKKILENPLESTRTSVDFGMFIFDYLSDGETPTRHRIRIFEGQVHLQPFTAELTLAHYDVSRRFLDPLLRITTFVGEPQRHDLKLNLGLWTEVGGLEVHKTSEGHSQLWKHATAQLTLDLWQAKNLDGFLRLRTGFGLEGQRDEVNGYRSAVTGSTALEFDVVADEDGFHNFRIELSEEVPHYFVPVGTKSKFANRMRARVQYEAIVLAINDQPLTFKLAASGEKRDDIPGVPKQWAFVLDAGLRFSLWAPPRPRS
ncbi:MAG TPA: hypothetical protein VK427_14225 [Kofleriaceae bacterium]|nr:hypothetical protein [Kofleriaceae bacterium]